MKTPKRSKDHKENLINTLFNDLEKKQHAERSDSGATRHTPTPWRVDFGLMSTIRILGSDSGSPLLTISKSHAQSRANAALIVKCVNAHEELLEAAKETLEHFNKYVPGIALDCVDSLRMAIAKAEGK